ncbi:hypothetical protein OQA88_993 [Cercophora sp. LCS_1]
MGEEADGLGEGFDLGAGASLWLGWRQDAGLVQGDGSCTGHNPTATQLHQPLARESREFRLITFESLEAEAELNLRLHIFSLPAAPPYRAVSYVWGSPADSKPIVVNNATVLSGVNLHDALWEIRSHLRKKHDEQTAASAYIWVDALCINQKDTLEKNHQVAMMNDIYSGAQEISLAWVVDYTDRNPFEPSRIECLAKLVHNEYWTRIWILQEVVLARHGQLLAGNHHITLDMFSMIWTTMHEISLTKSITVEQRQSLTQVATEAAHLELRGLAQSRLGQPSSLDIVQELCGNWLRMWRRDLSTDSCSDIFGLLEFTQDFLATDPRDRVFALQSLLSRGRRVMASDYALTEADVYARATLFEIERTGKLYPITWSGIGFEPNEPRLVGLPSWVTNFAEKRRKHLLFASDAGGSFLSVPEISKASYERCELWKLILYYGPTLSFGNGPEFIHVNWREMGTMPRITSASWVKTLFRCVFSTDETPFSGDLFRYFVWSMISHAEFHDQSLVWFLRTSIRPSPGFEEVILSARASLMRKEPILSSLGAILESGLRRDGELEDDKAPSHRYAGAFRVWKDNEQVKHSCGIILQQGVRSIFVSDDGFIGIAPPGAREGDSICVLLGHPVPFIIRPNGDDWDLVGLARIPGMMNGEIVEGLEANEGGSYHESSRVETIRLV